MSNSNDTPASILRLILTPECNLKCIYCHNEGFSTKKDIFPVVELRKLEKIFLSLKENSVKSVCLTGGDPLTVDSFEDVLSMVTDIFGGDNTHVSTNGILLDKHLDLMKEVGVSRINISCDAIDKTQYEKTTGFDLFDTVIANINKAVDYGFLVNVNCVTLKGINTHKDYICRMLDFWEEKGVRLSFLRLCFAFDSICAYRFDINELIKQLDNMGLNSHTTNHSNRPPTLIYKYNDMEVALRYWVPDRSIHPCKKCEKRSVCSEGLYHPRLGLNGTLRSCILREDLSLDLMSKGSLDTPLKNFLKMFDSVKDTWVPANLDSP